MMQVKRIISTPAFPKFLSAMVILHEISQGSSSSSSLTYDVFLSFRGIDTRLNFVNHLHKALEDANLVTFLDEEESETELYLKPELESAIKSSRSSVIVLSKNYASSTWCLEELVLILEQRKTSGQMVLPIFYHVNPTDVRKQENSFGNAMEKHRQRMEAETNIDEKSLLAQKMVTWKTALVQVANLKGKDANGRLETEFIEAIVMDIKSDLHVPLRSTLPDLIGVDYSVRFISSWLKDGSTHTADILTILGMDGVGKTSLAEYIYELHHILFKRSSFVVDINRKCRDEYDKLRELQRQVLADISEISSEQVPVQSVSLDTSKIETVLARNKVLLVLDDIDNLDQLNVLLGGKGFHPGSKIIITTKVASLASRYKLSNPLVQPKHTTLSLEGLNETSSLQLFSFHAFKHIGPTEGYKQVSKKLSKLCEGLPLVLKVLGCSLCDQDVVEWEQYIGGLKLHETDSTYRRVLQMSFDSLPSQNDKELFKHIACFFVGMDRDYTETILKACGIRTLHGIRNLLDRCLLAIGPRNELMMHQLLQDLGKDVVRQESLDKPWKRSRLWCHTDSFNVLQQKKGKGLLKGIVLDMRMIEKEKLHGSLKLRTDALSKMDNLMLLQLNYVQLKGSYKKFPNQLRWLCLHGFPSRSIPVDLQMENLVALDMSYSKIKIFDMSYSNMKQLAKTLKLTGHSSKDKRLLGSLKILNLSFSEQLRSLGGFMEFPALEKLIVTNCIHLTEVSESIEQCVELVIIDLSYCKKLEKLPTTLGNLKKLNKLLLQDCHLRHPAVEMRDRDSQEMARTLNIDINSQTSSSAITEAPHRPKFFRVSVSSSLENHKDPLRMSFEDIKFATQDFSREYEIGGGGFGRVYKGRLPHVHGNGNYTIVVKRLDTSLGQGDQQFYSQLQILYEHKHENVINLLGYSDDARERIIVYEYASRGSLDNYLNDVDLTWRKRLQICMDAAAGLAFLHGGGQKRQRVIHRDIKSANILLDDNWNAKVADFGLSSISTIDEKTYYIADHVCGTDGYCDPLYRKSGFLTKESDVYSFGVVLFEILCGRSTYATYNTNNRFLHSLVKDYFEEGKQDELVFEAIKQQIVPKSVSIFRNIAYKCLDDDREKRPASKEVLAQLKMALDVQDGKEERDQASDISEYELKNESV